ncbi:MAG: hypothetical protein LLG02_08780 [Pelosinus sp.]|nr:hypothetical protein [Pelosinus sp.]
MGYVLGCLMAGVSFLLNKLLVKFTGIQTVLYYSPIAEELLKTLPAHYLGADILALHGVFGLLEGIYDFFTSQNSKFIPLLLSVLGHSLFGSITVLGRYFTGEIWLGLIGGVFTHIIWNITAIRLMSKK